MWTRPVLCRLCECPVDDDGVRVDQLDAEKLSEWWFCKLNAEFDLETSKDELICQFCLWSARFEYENSNEESNSFPVDWWSGNDDNQVYFKYFYQMSVIKQCSVKLGAKSSIQCKGINRSLPDNPFACEKIPTKGNHLHSTPTDITETQAGADKIMNYTSQPQRVWTPPKFLEDFVLLQFGPTNSSKIAENPRTKATQGDPVNHSTVLRDKSVPNESQAAVMDLIDLSMPHPRHPASQSLLQTGFDERPPTDEDEPPTAVAPPLIPPQAEQEEALDLSEAEHQGWRQYAKSLERKLQLLQSAASHYYPVEAIDLRKRSEVETKKLGDAVAAAGAAPKVCIYFQTGSITNNTMTGEAVHAPPTANATQARLKWAVEQTEILNYERPAATTWPQQTRKAKKRFRGTRAGANRHRPKTHQRLEVDWYRPNDQRRFTHYGNPESYGHQGNSSHFLIPKSQAQTSSPGQIQPR